MVVLELSQQRIDTAKTLIHMLDKRNIPPHSAFWYFYTESREWKLVIAMKQVGTTGPKKIYHQIQMMLVNLMRNDAIIGVDTLELDDITLVKPDAPIIRLIRKVCQTGPGITGIRYTHDFVNGKLIEDVYIYRLQ